MQSGFALCRRWDGFLSALDVLSKLSGIECITREVFANTGLRFLLLKGWFQTDRRCVLGMPATKCIA